MFMKDKNKAVGVIIASMKKKPDGSSSEETSQSPESDGAQQDSSIGEESAADEIINAVHSKSPKALIEALKSFYEICSQNEEDSESPETESSESEPKE